MSLSAASDVWSTIYNLRLRFRVYFIVDKAFSEMHLIWLSFVKLSIKLRFSSPFVPETDDSKKVEELKERKQMTLCDEGT